MEVVKACGSALAAASEELRGARDVVMEAVKVFAFRYASLELMSDRDSEIEAMKRLGMLDLARIRRAGGRMPRRE